MEGVESHELAGKLNEVLERGIQNQAFPIGMDRELEGSSCFTGADQLGQSSYDELGGLDMTGDLGELAEPLSLE